MSRADTIKFELLYIVQVGQVVCLCLEDCPEYEGIVLRMNYNIEKHDHSHEIVLPFADSSIFKGTDTIRYRYIVSRYDDEKIKLRDVLDEKTERPMELSFQRQDYWNSFVHIFDRCDYQLKNSRIFKTLKMDQVISTTIRIQETIPIGRWLYMFIIDGVHPQKLESDFTKSKDQKNQMFFVEKMEKHQRSSGEQVWIYRRVTNMAELSRNNRFTFAIYESYLYDRRDKVWKVRGNNPNLPNLKEEEFDDIEKLAKILDQQGVKYSIIQNDGINQEEQKLLTNLKPNQILRDTEFIYEVTDDIDKRTILSVFLVIKGKGSFRMDPKEGKKLWNVFVALGSSELNGLEYFFDVNIIGAIQKSGQTIFSQDLRSTRRTGSEIIQYPRSGSHITVYSRSQFVEQRSYSPTYSNRTSNNNSQFETKLSPMPSAFYYIPSNRSTSSSSYSYVSNVRREQEKLKRTKADDFSVIHEKSTNSSASSFKNASDTLSSYSSKVGATVSLWTAPQQIMASISHSQFKALPHSCKSSLEKVADHLQSFNSLSREIKHLKMKFDELSTVQTEKQTQQKFQNVVFTEQYGPVSLELVQVVRKRTIQDDFKKEIDKLTKNSQNLRNLIKKQWDIEDAKDKTKWEYTQNEVQILAINMIVAAKLWGKQNYSGHRRVIDILNNYLQQEKYSREEIINVLYHLNDYVNNEKKYTYKVSHPMPRNCQKNIQDKVAAHFELMNNGSVQPFQVIQHHKLYKLFVLLVDCDIKKFIDFGKNKGLNIHHDEVSENLMRILINYAVIYSLGQHYDSAFSKFDVCGCAQFGPFCEEVSDKRFFSHDLISIRDKYQQTNKTNLQIISQNKNKIQDLKSQIQKTLESETEKMAVALISIQYDLKKLQQYFDSNPNRREFLHDVDLRNAYEKGLQKIDQSENWSEKYARIIDFKNTYQKDFQSFN